MEITEIRKMGNTAELNGILAELEHVRKAKDKNGNSYVAFDGKVKCGAEPDAPIVKFKSYVSAIKRSDNSHSENYDKVCKWLDNARPLTVDKDNPTKVNVVGSFSDNSFTPKNGGEPIIGTVVNAQFFNDFNEGTGFASKIKLEGFIDEIKEEVVDGEVTDNYILSFYGKDFSGKIVPVKAVVTPEMMNKIKEAGWEPGATVPGANFTFKTKMKSYVPDEGSFGDEADVKSTKTSVELYVSGGKLSYDSDSNLAFDKETMQAIKDARKKYEDQLRTNKPKEEVDF